MKTISAYSKASDLLQEQTLEIDEWINGSEKLGDNPELLAFFKKTGNVMVYAIRYIEDSQRWIANYERVIWENRVLRSYNSDLIEQLQRYQVVEGLLLTDELDEYVKGVIRAIEKYGKRELIPTIRY